MQSEKLLHTKSYATLFHLYKVLEESKLTYDEKSKTFNLWGSETELTEVGRDLGSDGLSLHKCLDYTNICTCQNILNSAVMICAFHCL